MTTPRPRPEIDPSASSILVVEDDRRMAAFLDRALSYAGYRVAMAEDGEQALAQAERQTPDLVLLDVMLPGKSQFGRRGVRPHRPSTLYPSSA